MGTSILRRSEFKKSELEDLQKLLEIAKEIGRASCRERVSS